MSEPAYAINEKYKFQVLIGENVSYQENRVNVGPKQEIQEEKEIGDQPIPLQGDQKKLFLDDSEFLDFLDFLDDNTFHHYFNGGSDMDDLWPDDPYDRRFLP